MTATVTDLFCGAGGSSTGAVQAGMTIEIAANHWQAAVDVHQVNHPTARHDCADISQVDPRRYPRTDVLLASPECTNHSQAKGARRRKQAEVLFDPDYDPAAERSRATMWCVGQFAEQQQYSAMIVENVVEAAKWTGWHHWLGWMDDLGYDHQILSHNSMFHGVPQSRDRLYIVFTRKGIKVDLEHETDGWCPKCEAWRPSRQAFKNGRTLGRYRQQWLWRCTTCNAETFPPVNPAATIIDRTLPVPRIGDRKKRHAENTRDRIWYGLARYGFVPIITAGAGQTHERTPGNRARPLSMPLPVQAATNQHALAVPPGFQVQVAHGKHSPSRTRGLDEPTFAATASNGQGIVEVPSFLIQTAHGGAHRVYSVNGPHPTVTAQDDRLSLIVPMRNHGEAFPADMFPAGTVSAEGNHHGLLVRNNTDSGAGEMCTPLGEPARTFTTTYGAQSLLVPYYSTGRASSDLEPVGTMSTRDRFAMVNAEHVTPDRVMSEAEYRAFRDRTIDDCGFRMLEPHEVAAAMAFEPGYIPLDLPKKVRVRLAGNAVCPPNMAWLSGRVLQALEAAA